MARDLHVSLNVIAELAVMLMLLGALVLGFALKRVFHRYARKFAHTWGDLFFSLLESLPIPLLALASLYNAFETLPLPRAWERAGSKLILALLILALFYFPAKVLILFLQRMGEKEPALERVTQPAPWSANISPTME